MRNSLYTLDESHDSDEIPNKATILVTVPNGNIHMNVKLIEDIYSYIRNRNKLGRDMYFMHRLVATVDNLVDFRYLNFISSQN